MSFKVIPDQTKSYKTAVTALEDLGYHYFGKFLGPEIAQAILAPDCFVILPVKDNN